MISPLPSENIWGDYYLLSHSQIWLKHANYLSDLISKTIKWHLMKSWICHKPSVGITAKRWWFVSTNFKISTSMTTLWHFSGSYARTGRNIRTYAIACTAAKDICYWIFFIITTCLSINSGTSYFWKRYPKRIGSNLSEESFLKPERKFQENYAAWLPTWWRITPIIPNN